MNADINNLTLGQLKELFSVAKAIGSCAVDNAVDVPDHPYTLGKAYFVRQATYHYLGRLVAVYPNELVFEDASWVASSGRFNNALMTGELDEVEPYPDRLILVRTGGIDATEWRHPLPREVK